MHLSQTLLDRVSHLTESMRTLKDRVREAVTNELSRIVSETVQEVLQLVLRRGHRSEQHQSPADPWEDDEYEPNRAIEPRTVNRPWSSWLMTAGQIVTWWLTRPVRPWCVLATIAGFSLAAYSQQPLVLATLAAAQTASELLGT